MDSVELGLMMSMERILLYLGLRPLRYSPIEFVELESHIWRLPRAKIEDAPRDGSANVERRHRDYLCGDITALAT
jgi:hypothetical protein